MAVTRLKRKGLRNKARAKQRQDAIKKLTRMPPIQNVDVDAIKEEFAKKSGKPVSKKKESPAEETPKQEGSKAAKSQEKPADEQPESASKETSPPPPKASEASEQAPVVKESVADTDTTAELKEPAKGSVADAEMMEEVVEEAEAQEDTPEVAPDVVSPEAGAPDETPSEATDDSTDEEKK